MRKGNLILKFFLRLRTFDPSILQTFDPSNLRRDFLYLMFFYSTFFVCLAIKLILLLC